MYFDRRIFCYISTYFFIVCVSFFWHFDISHAATISPLRYSVTLDPGSSKTLELTVINDSDATKTYRPVVERFSIDPQTGQAIFSPLGGSLPFVGSITPERVTLLPHREQKITYTVQIPADQTPGVTYLALLVEEVPAQKSLQIGAKQGALVFLYTAGVIHESLVEHTFAVSGHFLGKKQIELALENTGDIHVIPRGVIHIYNVWGTEVQTIPINSNDRKMVPRVLWKQNFLFESGSFFGGMYTADLQVQYGLSEQYIAKHIRFWDIQWPLLIGICVLVLIGCGVIILFFRKRKKMYV